jgi:hypothetical protein
MRVCVCVCMLEAKRVTLAEIVKIALLVVKFFILFFYISLFYAMADVKTLFAVRCVFICLVFLKKCTC